MANIAITTLCNRDCDYCFAGGLVTRSRSDTTHMSSEVFDRALDFVERSGIGVARLLGGEPTLHPRFAEFCDRVLARGLGLTVYSNGLMPDAAVAMLESIPESRLALLVNMPAPDEIGSREQARLESNLERLGRRAYAGFNIVSAGVSLDFLLETIARFHMAPRIRLGLAHTTLEGSNASLHPRFYPAVGLAIAHFADRAVTQGVTVEFDCGFVPCMFPEGFLEWFRQAGGRPMLGCSPILDILPHGEVISCYPLLNWRREALPESEGADRLRDRLHARFRATRQAGIGPACTDCDFRGRGECAGGCMAASMRRLRRAGGQTLEHKATGLVSMALPDASNIGAGSYP